LPKFLWLKMTDGMGPLDVNRFGTGCCSVIPNAQFFAFRVIWFQDKKKLAGAGDFWGL
jgi:hypothetical protein